MAPGSPTMSTTSSTRSRWEAWDTGFPEPLCGERNTRRPHPEANFSPNASLSSEDIDPNRIHTRQQRRSFRPFKKGKRTLSHGKIDDMADDLLPLGSESRRGLGLDLATPPSGALPSSQQQQQQQLQSDLPPSRDGGSETAPGDGKGRPSKDSTDYSVQSHEPLSPTTSNSPNKKRDAWRRLWSHGSK